MGLAGGRGRQPRNGRIGMRLVPFLSSWVHLASSRCQRQPRGAAIGPATTEP